ncbi:MAG: hypothetical protein KGJ55_05285 [Gammaproteobacteria bacterium]|nr:hypothetical protein [Gammaproteobacteria bacterium]
MKQTHWIAALMFGASTLLSGCAVTDVQSAPAFAADARWAMLPMVNASETPLAGERAEAIAGTLLRKRGLADLTHYPPQTDASGLPELDDHRRLESALRWARSQNFRYGVSGAVSEWTYKTGLDGEPAVGLTLQVIDIASGRVLWSASGADSGWGYDSLSGTAQRLLNRLIARLPLKR